MSARDAHIELLTQYAELLVKEAKQLCQVVAEPTTIAWHPATEVPSDEDILYIVKTHKGIVMFSQPINGKWLGIVNKWMPIPE